MKTNLTKGIEAMLARAKGTEQDTTKSANTAKTDSRQRPSSSSDTTSDIKEGNSQHHSETTSINLTTFIKQQAEERATTRPYWPQMNQSMDTSYNHEPITAFDSIIGHFYRQDQLRLRTTRDGYDLVAIISLQEAMERNSKLTSAYVRNMNTKARNNLVRKQPAAIELLRLNTPMDQERTAARPEGDTRSGRDGNETK